MSKSTFVPCPEGKIMHRMVAAVVLLLAMIGALPESNLWAQSAPELYKTALRALRLGEDYEAIKLLSKAIGVSPRNSRFYNDRGVAFKRSGNIEQAMADYSKALEIDPDFAGALNNRGVVLLLKGDYDGAIADFTRALGTQKHNARLYSNRAMAYHKKDELTKALADFEKAAAGGNRDPRAYVSWAECLLSKGDRNEAVKIYRRALQMANEPGLRRELEETLTKMTGAATVSGSDEPSSSGRRSRRHVPSDVARAVVEAVQAGSGTDSPRIDVGTSTESRGKVDSAGSELSVCRIPTRVLQVLETRAREHVVAGLSPPIAEIFRQGLWFLAEPDTAKALIRFEDVQKLAQRRRHHLGAAWCQVEISRIHHRTDSQAVSNQDLGKALDLFSRSGANEEAVITLLVMAARSSKAGRSHEAGEFCSRAAQKIAELRIPDQAPALAKEPAAQTPVDDEKPKLPRSAAPPLESSTKKGSECIGTADQKRPPLRSSSDEPKPSPVPADDSTVESPKNAESLKKPACPPKIMPARPPGGVDPSAFSAARELKVPAIPKRDVSDPGIDKKSTHRTGLPAAATNDRIGLGLPRTPIRGRSASAPMAGEDGSTQIRNPGDHRGRTATKSGDEAGSEDRSSRPEKHSSHSSTRQEPEIDRVSSGSASKEPARVISELLTRLKTLKARNEEEEMATVLEKLGEHYLRRGNDDRALHCLTAALGLMQKLGLTKGRERLLVGIGSVQERRGDLAPALENYSHAVFVSGSTRAPLPSNSAKAKTRAVAEKMGLKSESVLDAFNMLWKARYQDTQASETDALYCIGKLLEKAGRYDDSLGYLERSTASMLADKARLYHKTGKARQAERAQAEALEFFRRVDYSRYLQMKHQSRPAQTRLR